MFLQVLVYSILLLKKGIETKIGSNYWLCLFVFVRTMYVAPWMLGFAGWYDNQPYRDFMFYMPFQYLFLVGPLLYFYVQSLLNPAFKFQKKQILHLLPAIFYLFYSLIIFVYDKLIFKGYYFYSDEADKDFDLWYQNPTKISISCHTFCL